MKGEDIQTVTFGANLFGVKTWTSEGPNLYKMLISLKEEDKVTEIVPFNVGFRRIEIKQIDQIAKKEPQFTHHRHLKPVSHKI